MVPSPDDWKEEGGREGRGVGWNRRGQMNVLEDAAQSDATVACCWCP